MSIHEIRQGGTALLDALTSLRLAANLIDEQHWPQEMFDACERADFLLREARGEQWWTSQNGGDA